MKRYLSVAALAVFLFLAFKFNSMSTKIDVLQNAKKSLESRLEAAEETIAKSEKEKLIIADIDKRYTEELNNAKLEIDKLYAGVIAGSIRLRINATCNSNETAAASVVNATSPGLTNAAERNYFLLRERIEVNEKQILGLQSYINDVCLAE